MYCLTFGAVHLLELRQERVQVFSLQEDNGIVAADCTLYAYASSFGSIVHVQENPQRISKRCLERVSRKDGAVELTPEQ